MRATKTVSLWSFLLLAALLVLQLFPITGIFLMFFGGALFAGAMVHVFLISLLIEGYLRRVPRVLMILPVVAYGGYYALYVKQTIDIARRAAELRASNPKQVLEFDPKTQRLVTANAQTLIQAYAIPVAYQPEPNYTEGYLSYRLIPRGECMVVRDSQGRIITFGIFFNSSLQKQVCVLRFPEMPEGKIVKAVRTGDDEIWRRKWGISEQTTTLSIDGKVIGSYRSAFVWRLPLLPVGFVGCALIELVIVLEMRRRLHAPLPGARHGAGGRRQRQIRFAAQRHARPEEIHRGRFREFSWLRRQSGRARPRRPGAEARRERCVQGARRDSRRA